MEPLTPVQASTTPPLSPRMARMRPSLTSPSSPLRSPVARSPEMRSPRSQRIKGSPEPPEVPDKRLVIRKLVLINYKSYAGRQEVGPFNESFTAVVGPNGSGKSNVIDSLLFVFGFRAKKMRQDKLTGLIHKSETYPDLQFCRVEVHFEEIGVPDSDLVLAREVRRDGNNFYSLDDKRASYTQVQELLEQRGIDLRHKRFLILQGEVESIALMPPKAEGEGSDGLLEYLEDIIGTSNYKTRIEELEGETETLRQDCGEKQRRLDIVVSDLNKLDAERALIEQWMLNANRATVVQSKLSQLAEHRLRSSLQLTQADVDEQNRTKQQAEQQIAEKRQELAHIEKSLGTNMQRLTEIKQEQTSIQARLKAANVAQVKAQQRRGQLDARKKKLERELVDAQSGRSRSTHWVENAGHDLTTLDEKLHANHERHESAKASLARVQEKVSHKTVDIQAELGQLQAQVDPWRVKIAAKEQEITRIRAEAAAADAAQSEAESRYQEIDDSARVLQEEGRLTNARVTELEAVCTKTEAELTSLDQEIPQSETAVEHTRHVLEQLRPEVAQARESRASSQSRSKIEQELFALKIPGLYGRLGSLGSIDQKYDVAVSTAGPELNNFVVDTVATAKKCIAALRDRRLGRAKFMVLNKLSTPPASRPDQFPAPRLIDLVKPVDPQFVKAFYAALTDTQVVPTFDEATKIAFSSGRRNRVVTLDGVVVAVSGKISGGGKAMRGLMAKSVSNVSAEDLERLEKQALAQELELAEEVEKLKRLRSRRSELAAELPKMQTELNKERMTLAQFKTQFATVRGKRHAAKEEINVRLQAAKETKHSAEEAISSLEAEIRELETQSRSIEDQIQGLQKRILDAGGLELRELSSLVRDCELEDEHTRKRIEEIQGQIAEHESRARKFELQIETVENELSSLNSSPIEEEAIESIPTLETQAQAVTVQIITGAADIESANESASSLRGEIDEHRIITVDAQNALDSLRESARKTSRQLESVISRKERLELHDVSLAQDLKTLSRTTALGGGKAPDVKLEEDAPMANADSDAALQVLPELSPDELQDLNEAELTAELAKYEKACETGGLNTEVLEQYRSRHSEFVERKAVSDEAVDTYESVKAQAQRLKHRRYTEFMDGFLQISSKLKEMYQLLTMGGNAELELVDTMDPFAEGILFSVMPPKKSWRNIANLSGGEKTLSSLALVFALHHYKPTPLYVMDEIDAALDFRNVSVIANYIKERTRNGQFIVISLRNNMFELASRLVGVYKVNNMTSSVTLQTE